MNKTKIEWCDMSWNPVTGCYKDCPYCYAKKIANRFKPKDADSWASLANMQQNDYPTVIADNGCCPYPQGFIPTFYWDQINKPEGIKKPKNIFVCSMADLFGDWVPDEWIERVFDACKKAPQHKYLFLTKNAKRYMKLFSASLTKEPIIDNLPDNFWFGQTATKGNESYLWSHRHNNFLSIEPLQDDFGKWSNRMFDTLFVKWVIIGCETGNRKGKIIPKREWIENIVNYCKEKNVPVFMKNNLAVEKWRKDKKTGEMILVEPKVWDEPLIQEFPWRG